MAVVFGANWCEDCRALDKALHGASQNLVTAASDATDRIAALIQSLTDH